MSLQVLWWIFVGALLGSLLLSTVSYALRAMSRVALEAALEGRRHAEKTLDAIIKYQYDTALTASTLRLGANVSAIVAVAWYFWERYGVDKHPVRVFGWTLLITVPALLIFSVAIPQAWGKYAGEQFVVATWPALRVAHAALWPVVRVLKIFDEIVRRLAGVSIGEEPDSAAHKAEAEILSVVAEGTAEGTVDEDQQKMIEGVISFRDLQVGQIMTPRTEVVAVEVNMPILEVRDRVLKEGLSRVPVFEGTLDNVVGIFYAKDLLPFLNVAGGSAGDDEKMDLRKIMRPPFFVPRTKPLRDLLREFRAQQVHMAVVLDEYGGTSGVVTTEDIVEEIVGDIADEYERPEPAELRRLDERTVEVDARMAVSELNRALELSLPEDGDYHTIGGYVIATLGTIPPRGEQLAAEGVTITVIDAEPRRVKKLRLELPAAEAKEAAVTTTGV
ncbi:MAG TPA: hemolysin family protein [Phycisphaerae bacterium]|jgi:CBS domain containing-hemolysin-like protein|nr:hemolysin family protein [Phycisphaerae bacterium]